MGDELLGLFKAGFAAAIERQRDGAAQDMRVIGAAVAAWLAPSDDTSEMSRINAAVRVPTTLTHPST